MTEYRLVAQPQTYVDIEATYHWYESERLGLGTEFLQELRSTYDRIVQGPLKYQELRSGIRRALIRRFPYAVYLRSKSKLLSCLRCSMRAENQPSGSDAELNRLLKCNRLTAILGVHPSDPSLFHYLFSRTVMNWRTEFQLKGTEVKWSTGPSNGIQMMTASPILGTSLHRELPQSV